MKKQLISLAAISLFAFSAQASDVPYSYVDVEYNSLDEFDGFTLGGSIDLSNDFYAFGEFASVSADDVDVDATSLQIGAGYHYEVSPNTDLIGELSLARAEIDSQFGDASDTGFALGFGIRSMITSNLELNAKAQYVDINDDSDTGFEVGGLYYFDNGFALGAGYETDGGDLDGFSLKARFKF